ncbi:MAG TPA: methyltransferase domain-containing protein [Puia sp.]|jgi:ubiquinone/menaquinone biosynthesis C-methylase UbiE
MDGDYLYQRNGVYIPGESVTDAIFENLYLSVRQKEQRIFSNAELMKLPDVSLNCKHHYEWSVRKKSCKRLLTYLKKKDRFLKILEVGCGNGWLSHQMAKIPRTEVIGLDINLTELEQAAEVFTTSNLKFVYGDPKKNILQNRQFDIIVFAASIQYFPSFVEIIRLTLNNLSAEGEIHIIDSFFYERKDLEAARKRGSEYYRNIGFPEMANYYFHHLLEEMNQFNYTVRQLPNSFFRKIFFRKNIFPWFCIRHTI